MDNSSIRTVFLVSLAMTAFAANSVLCRLALLETGMDAGLFTLVRLVSGAVTLSILIVLNRNERLANMLILLPRTGRSTVALFCYATFFSYAYINMETATGALVLFASVQLAMIGYHFYSGNRLNGPELLGLLMSLTGFVFLLFPSASSPEIIPVILMVASGISWAVFTIAGKQNALGLSAISNMTVSFIGASVLAILFLPWFVDDPDISISGFFLAIGSGAVASALGYAIWYLALPSISVLQASVTQLSVPVIAAIGGVVIVGESITTQALISAIIVLGGILLVFIGHKH